jgi:flavin reductase (DIM6/NTAB) family NADH-FMN oxidoreductase RutF
MTSCAPSDLSDRKTPTTSHVAVEPAILYFGTPVVLISTVNEDGSPNLAPMSSAWWLGWACMLGLNASSKTTENLRRTRECVLNLPSADLVAAVDRLALTTGSNPVPENKARLGFQYVRDKFGIAGLTPMLSERVAPPRVRECPVQLEAVVDVFGAFGAGNPRVRAPMCAIEVRILRVHADESILVDDDRDRIDPNKWSPLIMSFREFFGLGDQLQHSRLAEFPERLFRPQPRATKRSADDPSQPIATREDLVGQ